MTDSPVEPPAVRVRERLNELGVGPMPTDSGVTFQDESPDAIKARDLPNGRVELSDKLGNAWQGTADEGLKALENHERGVDPDEIWKSLPLA